MARLFFALWPDTATRAALDDTARNIAIEGGRRVPASNLHITLAFLGAVDDARLAVVLAVGDRVQGRRFSIEFTEQGWWPGPKVAWIAPAAVPSPLQALVDDLRRGVAEAGLSSDARPYRPHLTIARKVSRKPAVQRLDPLLWAVPGFALVASVTAPAGAVYEVLRQWSLDQVGCD